MHIISPFENNAVLSNISGISGALSRILASAGLISGRKHKYIQLL